MLKQSSSRNLKGGRGYKVKHVAQMCLILAVTIWMLYQVRHCYFKKADGTVVKLGRKGLLPGVVEEEEDEGEVKGEANGVDEFEQADDLMEESEDQETEDNQIDDGSLFTNTKRNETDKYVKLQRMQIPLVQFPK